MHLNPQPQHPLVHHLPLGLRFRLRPLGQSRPTLGPLLEVSWEVSLDPLYGRKSRSTNGRTGVVVLGLIAGAVAMLLTRRRRRRRHAKQVSSSTQNDGHTLLTHSRFYVSTLLFVLFQAVSRILAIEPFRPWYFLRRFARFTDHAEIRRCIVSA